ncbi:MAG: TIGR04255 family protein [Desulfobacteraceae bacterium]|nr:TIGR04255 family protein [Desulfobacteraceae bacterium]
MKYKKNYLTNVIFQFRFDPILTLEKEKPADFQTQIQQHYPHLKEREEMSVKTMLSPSKDIKTELENIRKQWIFSVRDKSKSITIAANIFSLEYRKYESIEATEQDFNFLWGKFNSIYSVQTLNRVGLRYIDRIVLPSGDPLDWKGYINENIIAATLQITSPKDHDLARSMHAVYWLKDDHQITFQFGIYNSDFPNSVAKREFVLDYDCSSIGSTEASDAVKCLRHYNSLLKDMFEDSIDDLLREDMGVIEDATDSNLKGGQNG